MIKKMKDRQPVIGGIGGRILVMFLVIGVSVVSLISVVSIVIISNTLQRASFNHLVTVRENKKIQVQNYFAEKIKDTEVLATLLFVRQAVKDLDRVSRQAADMGFTGKRLMEYGPYKELVDGYYKFIDTYKSMYGVYDVFLFSPENGRVLITARMEDDFGTLMANEKTHLADGWVKLNRDKTTVATDMEPYLPSNKDPAMFILTPVKENGIYIGAVGVQIPLDQINRIMHERSGMGKTGEAYLVGPDMRMRSDSYLEPGSHSVAASFSGTVEKNGVDTKASRQSFKGVRGTEIIIDYRGKSVHSAWAPLNIGNTVWAIIAETDKGEINRPINKLIFVIIFIGLAVITALVFTAAVFSKRISNPIYRLTAVTKRITEGDLTARADQTSFGETGELGRSFNEMAQKIFEAIWLKTGLNEFTKITSGKQDLKSFGRSAICFLSEYIDAAVGALYVSDEDGVLEFISGYAFSDKNEMLSRYRPGEGLVGQAALDKKSILFCNADFNNETCSRDNFDDIKNEFIDSDYATRIGAKINYGIGEVKPKHLMITPSINTGSVKAVIVLGSMNMFDQTSKEFVEQAADRIGVEINIIQSREKIKKLLIETRKKTEALELQQEALISTNEELEAQAQQIQATEEELSTQQEELMSYNEELEKANRMFEKHKAEIEIKNIELSRANKTIKEKVNELAKANDFKSEFLANMSHELRTPLNSILILAKLLAENETGNLSKEQKESTEVIYNAGSSLLALINDILDISKIEAGKMEIDIANLDLSDFASGIEKSFGHIAEEHKVGFTVELADNLPEHISTDERKLTQIVKNLTANALKFTGKGTVKLSIRRPEASVKLSNIHLSLKKTVAISVSDTGIGIPPDRQKIIFEAFQQADPSISSKYGGTGLGLSISNKLAWYLGGEIQVKSEPGTGSTFTLFLPERLIWDSPVFEEKTGEQPGAVEIESRDKDQYAIFDENTIPRISDYVTDDRKEISPDDKTLLIIESNQRFTRALVNTARIRGFKCLVAENGETGLQFVYEYNPKAIMLSDKLTGMEGNKVLDKLKDDLSTRHIPVCAVTDPDGSSEMLARGACVYISNKAPKKRINEVLTAFENIINSKIRSVLFVGKGKELTGDINAFLKSDHVNIFSAQNDTEGLNFFQSQDVRLVIAGMDLPDSMIFDLLEKMTDKPIIERLPVMLYTERELTEKEMLAVKNIEKRFIIKCVKSHEMLLDTAALFLHMKKEELTEEQEKILKVLHKNGVILKNKHILVADDDMRNTFALAKMLRKNGMRVYMAENGKKAVELLDKKLRVDLVLMDIMMPVMDGYEAIKKIRSKKKFKTIPILALTAKAMKGDRLKCIKAGANDYIAKPIDNDRLLSMLKVWLYR